ncbi:coiled-coil domain-containing protein 74B-like [Silurus asotus]|uniref:Coiled-coil domain-containing protein 74B-like n=1 Tax=Silurus asotus TaxID=30991 RepID=A0AAD5FFK2_SILAS|nr:coiled-coil domain-containing protein 74B-like [Silurus asotus]
MSTGNLPPLRNLPSWSRVGTLDRTRCPLLISCECEHKAAKSHRHDHKTTQTSVGMDTAGARIASLEKDILFLQQTHKSTLEKLHEKIEHLKRANKELQYQLIMGAQHPPPEPCPNLNEKHCQSGIISSEEKLEARLHSAEHNLIVSLLPLRIRDGSSRPPRSPSLQECEATIRQLYNTNTLQSQELSRLKAVLTDVLNKKKVPPEVYNLAKTHLSDITRHHPHVHVREKVILPAIRQNLSSNLTERQKRAQDIHKQRLRRPVFS